MDDSERPATTATAFADALYDAANTNNSARIDALLSGNPQFHDCCFTVMSTALVNRDTAVVHALQRHGIVAGESESSRGPLHTAAKDNDYRTLAFSLAVGADPNVATPDGGTPLYIASDAGSEEAAAVLLAGGAATDIPSYKGRSALVAATFRGHTQIVADILAVGGDPNYAGSSLRSPLYEAAKRCDEELVALLLDAGANPDGGGRESTYNPLLAAAAEVEGGPTVALLLAAGAKTVVRRRNMFALFGTRDALSVAVCSGSVGAIVSLLCVGGDAERFARLGSALLCNACCQSSCAPLVALLAAGLGASNVDGVLRACCRGLDSPLPLEMLLAAGADPNTNAPHGRVLHDVCRGGSVEVVRALLAGGASVSLQDKFSRTPLSYAARGSSTAIIAALLDAGADPNATDADGNSCLHAVQKPDVAAALVAGGADYELQNKRGLTVLSVAIARGAPLDCLAKLVRLGAVPSVDVSDASESSMKYLVHSYARFPGACSTELLDYWLCEDWADVAV